MVQFMMIKYLVIFLLISTQLFAVKIKAKQKGHLVHVKMLLQKGVKTNHITALVGERIVFDTSISNYSSRHPFFKFSYKFKNYGDKIKIVTTDNNGKEESFDKQIKSSTYDKNRPVQKVKNRPLIDLQKTWTDAIVKNAIKDKIFLKTSYPFENISSISVGIKSDEDLESIIILQGDDKYSIIALFSVPFDTKVNYKISIKMKEPSNITIIAKALNGHWYKDDLISMFNRKCKNNSAQACKSLAMIYNFGKLIDADIQKSEKFSIKGCNLGSAYACGLVKYHFDNEGDESFNAQVQLCEHNVSRACNKLGRHYLRDKKDTWVIQNNRYYLTKNIPEALRYFQKACNQDSACCNEVLVEMAQKALLKEK